MPPKYTTCANCWSKMCQTCDACHGCGWTAQVGILSAQERPKDGKHRRSYYYPVRSQKLKGMEILPKLLNMAYTQITALAVKAKVQADDDLPIAEAYLPAFVRPCPVRPRHGFVDSRVVKTAEELAALWKETREADPEGEMMLTPMFNKVVGNAIWTPSLLTLGDGNDGATAGKNTINMALFPGKLDDFRPYFKEAGVGPEDAPYIEAIYNVDERVILTQLRAGPPLKTAGLDFVPSSVTVEKVEEVSTEVSLLAWEKRCLEAREENGLVFYHPGGSPCDHISVHARSCGIPLMITRRPEVGETLAPIVGPTPPLPADVLKGFIVGDRIDIGTQHAKWATLMLLGFHHAGAGGNGFWLGLSAALMLRFGGTALRGEARHRWRGTQKMPDRMSVYSAVLPRRCSFHRAVLSRTVNLFRYGNFQGSIGGIKWAQCGLALLPLFNAIRDLARTQGQEEVNVLTRALNVAVNQAHNGGWWMNKFVDQSTFSLVQEGYPHFPILVGNQALVAGRAGEALSPAQFALLVERIAAWPMTEIKPIEVTAGSLSFIPGASGVYLNLKSRLLGSFMKPMVLGEDTLNKLLGLSGVGVYVQGSSSGLRIAARANGGEHLLWEEEPLKVQEVPAHG